MFHVRSCELWQFNTWLLRTTVFSHMSMHELTQSQSLLAAGSDELLIAKTIQRNEQYYVSLCCNHPPWSWLNPKWVVAVVHRESWLCTDGALKKVLFLKVCHVSPSAPWHRSWVCNIQRLLKVGSTRGKWGVFTFTILQMTWLAIFSQLSVAPRWWRTTTARQITPTPAWCQNLCTMLRLSCAAHRT